MVDLDYSVYTSEVFLVPIIVTRNKYRGITKIRKELKLGYIPLSFKNWSTNSIMVLKLMRKQSLRSKLRTNVCIHVKTDVVVTNMDQQSYNQILANYHNGSSDA